MKKIITLITGLLLAGNLITAQTTFTWAGSSPGNFTVGANWVGGVAPGIGDAVLFNNTANGNCTITSNISVSGFTISGYTGLISCGATQPFIDGSFVQSTGTFVSTSNLSRTGGFVIDGGHFIRTGGTFTHNNGIVRIGVKGATTASISGTTQFSRLQVESSGLNSAERIVNFGSTSTATLFLAGGAHFYSYQGSVTTQTRLAIEGTNDTDLPTANTGTFILSGSMTGLNRGLISPSSPLANPLPNVQIAANVNWASGIDLTVMGNWTHSSGNITQIGKVVDIIGSGVTISGAAINGTAVTFDNLYIHAGASVSIPTGTASIVLTGGLFVDGAISNISTAMIGYSGNSGSIESPLTIGSINILNSSDLILNGSAFVTVLDSISIGANSSFDCSGTGFTLQANGSKTARIGRCGSGASVFGNFTTQTYAPGPSTGWANLGSNGVDNVTVGDWDGQIPITCTGCTFGPDAIPSGWFKSVQGWIEGSCDYDTTLTSTSTLTPGKGFWVYVGDGPVSTTDLSWSFSGPPVIGPLSFPVSNAFGACPSLNDDGFNLVANPYASPISWNELYTIGSNSDLDNAYYVWNANVGGGNGGYAIWDGLSGINGATDVIPAGQGFYVDNSINAPGFGIATQIDFAESIKSNANTSANPLLRSGSATKSGNQFRLLMSSGNIMWDESIIRIHPAATFNYDRGYEARKLFATPGYVGYPGTYNFYNTISTKDGDGMDYAIQSIPASSKKANIPVLTKVTATGPYEIKATEFDNYQSCIILWDKQDNSYHDLKQGSYTTVIADTITVPRFEIVVCESGSAPLSVAQLNSEKWVKIGKDESGAFVKTMFDKQTTAKITVYNIVGQQLINDVNVEGTENMTRLNIGVHNQVVIIKVTTDNQSVVRRVIID